jgi:prefoldin subunit 4
MLGFTGAQIEGRIDELESRLTDLRDQMAELKIALYARFGKSINLES